MAIGVRFSQLGADEYWLDELHSLANSAGKRASFEAFEYGSIFYNQSRSTDLDERSSIAAVVKGMRDDTHPPLYFVLLNVWRRLFGDGEFATRSLSAGFSVLSIMPLALLFRRLGYPWAGMIAAGFLALAFGHIHMAQQNRQYSAAMFLIACSYLFLVMGEDAAARGQKQRSRVAWVAYAFSLYLAMLTHYFALLPLAGQVVYGLVRLRGPGLRSFLVAGSVAAAVFGLTWGGSFLDQQAMINRQPWLNESGSGHVAKTFARMADLPLRLLFDIEPFRRAFAGLVGGLAIMTGCLVAAARMRSRAAFLMGAWFAAPCILLLIADLVSDRQTLNHLRYPVIAVGGLAGLLSLAVTELPRNLRHAVVMVLAAAMVLSLPFPTTRHADARPAVAELNSRAAGNDLIIYDAIDWPQDWIPQFYAPMDYYRARPGPTLLLREPPSVQCLAAVQQFQRIFVVSPRVDSVPNPTAQTHQLAGRSGHFWQVGWIYLFERR